MELKLWIKVSVLAFYCSFSMISAQASELRPRASVDSVYFLGYGGLLTVGYQRLIHERVGINVSAASIALLHEDLRYGFSFPINLSFYPIGKEHRLFFDFGINLITKGKSNPMYDFNDGFNRPFIIGLGYNYHPYQEGVFIKLGIGQFIYEPRSNPESWTTGTIYAFSFGRSL